MVRKITIFLSHPNLDNSFINKYLADIHKKSSNFCVHHLDKSIKNGYFDLDDEKKLLQESSAIIWQFPIYWYNSPASLRQWQDQVLSPIVYSNNNFLKGKSVAVVFTAGAAEEHYSHTGLNRYTAEEMLRPFEMTANASGMIWHKPLGIYECSAEMSEAALQKAEAAYKKLVEEL